MRYYYSNSVWIYKCCSSVFFFFFKQKTAYEMRISDWSSDVCSSDLDHRAVVGAQLRAREAGAAAAGLAHRLQLRAQALVGADAAGDHQYVAAGGIERAFALDRQGVDHRVLEAAGDVGAGQIGRAHVRTPLPHAPLLCRLPLENKKKDH